MGVSNLSTPQGRDALVELLARYASIPDTKDCDHLPYTVFSDHVTWDFTSLTGAPAARLPLDELLARLRPAFAAYTATHHAVTNHRISTDGERAAIRAHIRAEHWLPPELVGSGAACWLVVGFYDDEAVRTPDGWRLTRVKLTVTHQENAHLRAIARGAGQRIMERASAQGE
jgi:SnoaL-like domain